MLALVPGRAATMARAPAGLPAGVRLSDHVSLGVIARTFPIGEVRRGLGQTGRGGGGGGGPPAPVQGFFAPAPGPPAPPGTPHGARRPPLGRRRGWGVGG